MKLNKIEITNFKNIKNKTFNLTDLNEFYGDNATGKTAVLDAIKFCLVGDKKDVDKISTGAKEAEVKLNIEIGNTPIDIKTTINIAGKVSCTLNVNSIKSDNPRTFIRKHVNSINFNPLLMLDKKDRFKRLLSLIPLKLNKEDVIIPDTDKAFPIANPLLINYDAHGVEVLTSIDKDLRGARHSIYRERVLLQKVLEDAQKTYGRCTSDFATKYEEEVDMKLDYEDCVKAIARYSALHEVSFKTIKEIDENISKTDKERKEIEALVSLNEKAIKESEDMIIIHNNKIKENKASLGRHAVSLSKNKDVMEIHTNKKEIYTQGMEGYDAGLSELDKNKCKALDIKIIKDFITSIAEKQEAFDKVNGTWELYNKLIQKKFPQFQQTVLKPITKAVPNLKVEGEKILYNGVSIDELSTSELLSLSIKFISLNDKEHNLLLIDKLETLDENSIAKLDVSKFVIVASRVGKNKIKEIKGSEWNSVKMGE